MKWIAALILCVSLALAVSARAQLWSSAPALSGNNDGLRVDGWTMSGTAKVVGNVTTSTWKNADGATVKSEHHVTKQTAWTRWTITASLAANVGSVTLVEPSVYAPAGKPGTKIFNSNFGGVEYDWPKDWAHGNSSKYPYYCYSSMDVFRDSSGPKGESGAGFGISAWNDQLYTTTIHWVSMPGGAGVNPIIVFEPNLARGQSTELLVEVKYYASGLPDAHVAYYRKTFLTPWLKASGITERSFQIGSPIYVTGWPVPDGGGTYHDGDLAVVAQRAVAGGAKALLIKSTGEARPAGQVDDPDPRAYPWGKDAKAASAFITLGFEIDPKYWSRSGPLANLDAPDALANRDSFIAWCKASGVSFVYMDTWTGPQYCSAWTWIDWQRAFNAAGITTMVEGPNEISAAISGSGFFWPYQGFTPLLPKAINPSATLVMLGFTSPDGWWGKAGDDKSIVGRGIVPVLPDGQIQSYIRMANQPSTNQ